jgi:hypothetical protein
MLVMIRNNYRIANTLFGQRSLCTLNNNSASQVQKTGFPYFESIEIGIMFLGVLYLPYKIFNEKRKSVSEAQEKVQALPQP